MAQVDFSNAVLDVYNNMVMTYDQYLQFDKNATLYSVNNVQITSGQTKTIITNTPSKVSILFTGAFTASGTEFYFTPSKFWRVSNISFSANDTYSFVIDIETSGNT